MSVEKDRGTVDLLLSEVQEIGRNPHPEIQELSELFLAKYREGEIRIFVSPDVYDLRLGYGDQKGISIFIPSSFSPEWAGANTKVIVLGAIIDVLVERGGSKGFELRRKRDELKKLLE